MYLPAYNYCVEVKTSETSDPSLNQRLLQSRSKGRDKMFRMVENIAEAFQSRQQQQEKWLNPTSFSIVIHPPLILENLLPVEAIYQLVHAEQNRVLYNSRLGNRSIAITFEYSIRSYVLSNMRSLEITCKLVIFIKPFFTICLITLICSVLFSLFCSPLLSSIDFGDMIIFPVGPGKVKAVHTVSLDVPIKLIIKTHYCHSELSHAVPIHLPRQDAKGYLSQRVVSSL